MCVREDGHGSALQHEGLPPHHMPSPWSLVQRLRSELVQSWCKAELVQRLRSGLADHRSTRHLNTLMTVCMCMRVCMRVCEGVRAYAYACV